MLCHRWHDLLPCGCFLLLSRLYKAELKGTIAMDRLVEGTIGPLTGLDPTFPDVSNMYSTNSLPLLPSLPCTKSIVRSKEDPVFATAQQQRPKVRCGSMLMLTSTHYICFLVSVMFSCISNAPRRQ